MKRRILVSTLSFSVFGLIVPVIWTICPAAVKFGYGYGNRLIHSIVVLTFPTILFSFGLPPSAMVGLIEANFALFAAIGALIGLLANRVRSLVTMYVTISLLLLTLAGYYSGFRPASYDWLALGVALPVYALPFWIVCRHVKRNSNE